MKNKITYVFCQTLIIISFCKGTLSVEKYSKLDACSIDKVNIATAEKAVIRTGTFQHTESDEDFLTTNTMDRENISNIVTETPHTTNQTEMSIKYGYANTTTTTDEKSSFSQ